MKFEWNHAKERDNVARHGVSFSDAKKAFDDPKALVLWDEAHSSSKELRWWLLGAVGTRVMLVRYTHRPIGVIRIIGAGYWKSGRDYYEKYRKENSI
ncbi:MAG: BrnT family toxin [Opitutaceae bacterium]